MSAAAPVTTSLLQQPTLLCPLCFATLRLDDYDVSKSIAFYMHDKLPVCKNSGRIWYVKLQSVTGTVTGA